MNWVHNLRAAGEAILAHGRRSEHITVVELPPEDAAPILKASFGSGGGGGFTQAYFEVTAASSLAEFEREALRHPVFLVQRVADMRQETAPGSSPTQR